MQQVIEDEPVKIEQTFNMNSFLVSPFYKEYLDCILVPEGAINARIEKLAYDGYQIVNYYQERDYQIIVILKGSIPFYKKLEDNISMFYKYGLFKNKVISEFAKCKSYVNDQSTGQVKQLLFECQIYINQIEITSFFDFNKLKGKEILIVEDIIDSGMTLQQFCKEMKKYDIKSIKIAAFLKKSGVACKFEGNIDFLGFIGPPLFYVGFGLDYNQLFRDLPHLAAVNDKGKIQFAEKKDEKNV